MFNDLLISLLPWLAVISIFAGVYHMYGYRRKKDLDELIPRITRLLLTMAVGFCLLGWRFLLGGVNTPANILFGATGVYIVILIPVFRVVLKHAIKKLKKEREEIELAMAKIDTHPMLIPTIFPLDVGKKIAQSKNGNPTKDQKR